MTRGREQGSRQIVLCLRCSNGLPLRRPSSAEGQPAAGLGFCGRVMTGRNQVDIKVPSLAGPEGWRRYFERGGIGLGSSCICCGELGTHWSGLGQKGGAASHAWLGSSAACHNWEQLPADVCTQLACRATWSQLGHLL